MSVNTYDQIEYLKDQLAELGVDDSTWFNPSRTPGLDYIPVCTQCAQDYEAFRVGNKLDAEVEMKHPASCLWHAYYVKRIKTIYPSAKIVRKKNRK